MNKTKCFIAYFLLMVFFNCTFSAFASDGPLTKKEKLLRYQEVFHHFYRKDKLNALINLQAGFATNSISSSVQSNQLLLGTLYNSYGVSNVGTPLLQNMAKNANRNNVGDLAWFYLAKEYFREESFGKFEEAVNRAGNTLQPGEQSERNYMLGMHFTQLKDFTKAEAVLASMGSSSVEYPFLMFNLGAAYLKANQIDQGIAYISKVGNVSHQDEIALSLKDKANVVLGYHYLRSGQSEKSIQYFEQVRMEGAFSEKALLGLGWAYSQTNQHRRSLVPWLLLAERDPIHIEVQEVLMAVPYSYNELDSRQRSVELYRASIVSYEEVKKKLEDAIGFVESTSLFSVLFVNEEYDDYAISRQLKNNIHTDLGRLLFELLKEKEIQEMLDEYRDLLQLRSELERWNGKLESMNFALGKIENVEDLPEFPHDLQARSFYTSLPGKVERKVQYKEELITLGSRIKLQQERLVILLELYEQKIRERVLKDLKQRSQYIVTYLSQTRYSLAELLDKSRRAK